MNQHTQSQPTFNRDRAFLLLEGMEEQKNKLQAMLITIRNAAPSDDFNFRMLIQVANDIVEDHADWYRLRECLGIKEGASNEPEHILSRLDRVKQTGRGAGWRAVQRMMPNRASPWRLQNLMMATCWCMTSVDALSTTYSLRWG